MTISNGGYNWFMPKVSILLPIYNAAATLGDTLQSIAVQTLTDFEVVAVDDGSTDDTSEILARWAQQDDRIRIVTIPHGGVIAAANAGLAECGGKYIARMDADDSMYPTRLEKQATALDAHPEVDVVSCLVEGGKRMREGFRIYLEWLNGLVTNADIRREMFVESPIPNPSAMFRREVIEKFGMMEDRGWPEDYDFWLRLYQGGAVFAKVPEVLLRWHDSPNRLTRTDSRYSLENFIRAKMYYIQRGPLAGRDAVIVWGAGMMGRRVSKYLVWEDAPLQVFVDIDPKKIGRTRRGKPIIAPDELMGWWNKYDNPVILAAVGARGARGLIRERLTELGLVEGRDWWGVA